MFNVLSFDYGKVVTTLSEDGRMIVRKKTVEKEHRNISLARRHLLKHQPIIASEKYGATRILVAEIVEWDEKNRLLSTLFCNGENIERLLRESVGTDRDPLIELIRKSFESFRANGFLWGDFAPRNVIWDRQRGIMWLVDFERNLILRDCPVEQHVFNRYVRNYSYEEFSCFLTLQESAFLFEGFLDESNDEIIPVEYLTSKRKRLLLKDLFGGKEYYTLDEIRHTEDIMVEMATPFLIHGTYFFPMDLLDFIGSKGGANEYVRTIITIHDLGEHDRFSELKKRAEALQKFLPHHGQLR